MNPLPPNCTLGGFIFRGFKLNNVSDVNNFFRSVIYKFEDVFEWKNYGHITKIKIFDYIWKKKGSTLFHSFFKAKSTFPLKSILTSPYMLSKLYSNDLHEFWRYKHDTNMKKYLYLWKKLKSNIGSTFSQHLLPKCYLIWANIAKINRK